jgi:FKBP-type peptidyl-prolyl cis-trans isomerase FklB
MLRPCFTVPHLLLVLMLAAPLAAQTTLKTDREKVSYGFGLNVGRGMLRDGLKTGDIELQLFMQGFQDALGEKTLNVNEKEFAEAYNAYIAPQLKKRAEERMAKIKTDGEAFLAENKKKPDVKTTASGLQYKIIKQGKGKTPKATDAVRTMYKGTFLDGSVFDESPKPTEFPVNRVIKGWTEALQLMHEGDKWQLFVPAALAYGEQGFFNQQTGNYDIPPHSTLIFEVELLEVVPLEDVPVK